MAQPVTLETITFSEQPIGTTDPVFAFAGVLPGKTFRVTATGQIVTDTDNPDTPGIAANKAFIGPVVFTFNAPVSGISLQAGFFDAPGMSRVVIEGPNGFMVEVQPNAGGAASYESFSFDYGENVITSVTIESTGAEPNGFAVDNLEITLRPESRDAEVSGEQAIDSLLGATRWNGKAVTWSFLKASSDLPAYGDDPETFAGSTGLRESAAPMSDGQKAMTAMALGMWDGVSGLSLQQVNDTGAAPGMMRFGVADIDGMALGFRPGDFGRFGDVWLDAAQPGDQALPGSIEFLSLLRETGRALGLKEPDSAGGSGVVLAAAKDSLEFSVMSNRSFPGADLSAGFSNAPDSFPQSLMMNDIAAIQHLYGANFKANSGGTTYAFDPTQERIFETIWDGGGVDTYDASAYDGNVSIDLTPGKWSVLSLTQLADLNPGGTKATLARGNVFNAKLFEGDERSLIENAIGGGGRDLLKGNQADNLLVGGGGRDELLGTAGRDQLVGEAGSDVLSGGSGNDRLTGGGQQDFLAGDGGKDRFIYARLSDSRIGAGNSDAVADFERGQDKIDLSGMDANSELPGRQAWVFVGFAEILQQGELGFLSLNDGVLLQGEATGDREVDFQIIIAKVTAISADDLILT